MEIKGKKFLQMNGQRIKRNFFRIEKYFEKIKILIIKNIIMLNIMIKLGESRKIKIFIKVKNVNKKYQVKKYI